MKANTPHRSTTHSEMFFHIDVPLGTVKRGTVFFREELEGWYGVVAKCHEKDQFCRKVGRTVARRRYFVKDPTLSYMGSTKPTYEQALSLYNSSVRLPHD